MALSRRAWLAAVITGLIGALVLSLLGWVVGPTPPPSAPIVPEGLLWVDLSALAEQPLPIPAGEELRYAFGWNDLKCADLILRTETIRRQGHDEIVLSYDGGTNAAIRLLWSCEIKGTTWVDADTLLPLRGERTTKEESKEKRSIVTFDRKEYIAQTVTEKLSKHKTSVDRVPFARQGLDLPSALLILRLVDVPEGGKAALEVVYKDKDFAVEITGGPTKTLQVEAGTFPAHALDLRVITLTGTESERETEDSQYRSLRIWFSQKERLPLRLEAVVGIGTVTAELVASKP